MASRVYISFLIYLDFYFYFSNTLIDTIIYASSGHGTLVTEGGSTRKRLGPGDFALIPAYTKHQEANDSDEEVVWIITRSGKEPVVVNLEGWGGQRSVKEARLHLSLAVDAEDRELSLSSGMNSGGLELSSHAPTASVSFLPTPGSCQKCPASGICSYEKFEPGWLDSFEAQACRRLEEEKMSLPPKIARALWRMTELSALWLLAERRGSWRVKALLIGGSKGEMRRYDVVSLGGGPWEWLCECIVGFVYS